MVDVHFPQLKDSFTRYRYRQIKILGALTYKSYHGSSISRFYFLPPDFQLQQDCNYELHVVCDLDSTDQAPIPFTNEVQKRLDAAYLASMLPSMSLSPNIFICGKDLVRQVYDWLQQDLDDLIGWRDIGQKRSHDQYQQSGSVNLPPRASLYFDFVQTEEPSFMDWPEL